jgi:hypothetical protein
LWLSNTGLFHKLAILPGERAAGFWKNCSAASDIRSAGPVTINHYFLLHIDELKLLRPLIPLLNATVPFCI